MPSRKRTYILSRWLIRSVLCYALELEGKQVNRRLSDEVVSKHPITDSLGRTQLASFVNEDGLYDVILDSRKTAEPLLDKLPGTFTVDQLREERARAGQSSDVKMLLSRYCKNGKLEKISKGVYRKMEKGNIVTVTKICDPNREED